MHSLSAADDTSAVKFRGDTYDAAVEAAREALGPRVKVIAADRIRRGGIGGFFATELGVEVSVALHDETVDQALERLVAATAEEESSRWFEQLTSTTQPPAAIAAATPAAEPSPVQRLTARAVVGSDTIVGHVTVDAAAPAVPATDPPVVVVAGEVATAAASAPAPARRRILLPTRGHVDLAVAAAAELARLTSEQLTSEQLRGRRVAVHVVVTSDDGRSVEADAVIEDMS
jgi:hypothetical protein